MGREWLGIRKWKKGREGQNKIVTRGQSYKYYRCTCNLLFSGIKISVNCQGILILRYIIAITLKSCHSVLQNNTAVLYFPTAVYRSK